MTTIEKQLKKEIDRLNRQVNMLWKELNRRTNKNGRL